MITIRIFYSKIGHMVTNKLGEWAKARLMELAKEMDLRLNKYWDEEIEKNFGFNPTQKKLVHKILCHSKEHNLRSAKRARSAFVIYGYRLGKKLKKSKNQKFENMEGVWRAAEAVELVHTALLMHDDFMDGDKIRRGRPTTQEFFGEGDAHYGDTMAVNVGDAILCLGFERLLECSSDREKIQRIMKQVLRGITNTAFGQAYDVSLSKIGEITEEKVMSLHRAKTAIYTYENPLMVGGLLAGLPEDILEILSKYSVDGGIAFQLQDDVLGVYGNEEKIGKSANSDLLQGKVTLLVVKVMEMGTENQKEALLKVWGKLMAEDGDIEAAKLAIRESGAHTYSVNVARKYAAKAADTAASLRGKGLNEEAIDYLEGIARYMVEREV